VILKAVLTYIIGQLDQRQGGNYLILDATSWEFGKVRIQLLVLSILYYSYFHRLGKAGQERPFQV